MILAGGLGSRFGTRPKGLAIVGGERVVDRVAAALRETTDRLLLVANDPAADGWMPGIRRVSDVHRGVGPLGGIHAALAKSGGAALIVAWDMPFVSPALLSELRRLGGAGYTAVVPESAPGMLEPTCAFYAGESRPALDDWLDSGHSGAAEFLTRCAGVHRVPAAEVARFGDPARLFFSVNTPDALERAEAMLH